MVSVKIAAGAKAVMWSWHETKLFLEHSVAFSSDSIHVIAGVLILLAAARLLGKPIGSWWPWCVVFLLSLLNEIVDLWSQPWPHPGMQYGEGAKDVLLTMFVPTVLVLSVRFHPGLFQRMPSSRTV